MSGFHPFGGKLSRHFTGHLAPEDAYLSYYDIRLTKDDVTSIKNDWLTDNAIAFWEEYLEREKLSHYPRARINLLRPSMVMMLNQTQDVSSLKDALPNFKSSSHVFLPINDSTNPSVAESGSHWSLLLVSIIDAVAFHYDSLNSANTPHARKACAKLSELIQRPIQFNDLTDTPEQENMSDCGVYVCLTMEELLINRLLQNAAESKIDMSMSNSRINASQARKDLVRLIESFRSQGRKSQSRSPSRGPSSSPPRVGD